MTWVTVGVSVGSAILGSRAENKAGKIRSNAFGEAAGITNAAYDRAEGFLDPRYEQEQDAIQRVNTLLGLPGGDDADVLEILRSTPGHQFRLDQGRQARERSAAAGGGLVSGNTLTALEEYGQGLADETFNDYLQNVLAVSSQGADRLRAGLATERGNILSDFRLGAAGARASGVTGSANALIGGATSALDTINYNRGLRTPGVAPRLP